MVIEKGGDGRVAMIMSDQAWLWARGYDGGGPYNEMFRRLSHWLLGEPDLDAEKLSAQTNGDTVMIERRTLSDAAQNVSLQKPDGTTEIVTLEKIENGLYRGSAKTAGQGAYRLSSGDLTTITAIGALNPKELSDLTPTIDILAPFSDGTGGGAFMIEAAGLLPSIRRVKPLADKAGDDWIGLIAHNDYVTRASKRAPLAPGLLFFALALLALAFAWRREGK